MNVKCSSTITHKNFKEALFAIADLPIKIGDKSAVLLNKNKIYLIFSVFMQILLVNIHFVTSSTPLFQHIGGILMIFLGIQVNNVQSLTSKINLNKLDELGRQLTKMRRRNGPKFEGI